MAAIQHSEAEGLTFEKMAKTIALGTEIFSAAMSLVCGPQQTIPLAGERIITLEEVSWHDTPKDCWIVVYDRVYDVTDFLDEVSAFGAAFAVRLRKLRWEHHPPFFQHP